MQQTLWGEQRVQQSSVKQPTQERPIKPTTAKLELTDPRPDLRYDSKEWEKLFFLASEWEGLAKILHGFRCGGLRITKQRRGYVLCPDYDTSHNNSLWANKTEYDIDKNKWLMPYAKEITQVMRWMDTLDGFEIVEEEE